jgi:site-specific recombinase XerD
MDSGYSRWTIRSHVAHVSRFNAYLGTVEDPSRESLSAQDVEGFLRAYPLQCRNRGPLEKHLRRVRRAINRFVDYLRQEGVFEQSPPAPLYQPLLDAYRAWMQRERRVAAGTLALRCHSLSGFLRRLGTQATVEGLAHLSGDQVERLFLAQARGMGQAARRSLQSAVRTFLRFCLARGYICQPLRIPLKAATDSGAKAATQSTRSLPPIPGESCRLSERSDAGFGIVTPKGWGPSI